MQLTNVWNFDATKKKSHLELMGTASSKKKELQCNWGFAKPMPGVNLTTCSNLLLVNDHELLVLSWNEHLDTQNVCIQQYSMLHEHLDDLDADQCAMR